MRIELYPSWLLNFKEMPQLPVNIDVPLLISERGDVLIGNSLKNYIVGDTRCVIINNELADHLEKWLEDLEKYLIEENDMKRYHEIEKEVQDYLREANLTRIDDNLFLLEREIRTIEETEFDKPGKFKFKKSRKKEDSKDDNLFSCFGE